MPPNCVLDIDDVLKEWTWREQFDLIHMRIMIGSFDPGEWDRVYKQVLRVSHTVSSSSTLFTFYAYGLDSKLRPDGWIEQLEAHPAVECDDGSSCQRTTSFAAGARPSRAVVCVPAVTATLPTPCPRPSARSGSWMSKKSRTSGPSGPGPAIGSTRRPGRSTSSTGCPAWRAGACGCSPSSARPSPGQRTKWMSTWPSCVLSSRIRASTYINGRKLIDFCSKWLPLIDFAGAVYGLASRSQRRLRRPRRSLLSSLKLFRSRFLMLLSAATVTMPGL